MNKSKEELKIKLLEQKLKNEKLKERVLELMKEKIDNLEAFIK